MDFEIMSQLYFNSQAPVWLLIVIFDLYGIGSAPDKKW